MDMILEILIYYNTGVHSAKSGVHTFDVIAHTLVIVVSRMSFALSLCTFLLWTVRSYLTRKHFEHFSHMNGLS